MNDESKLARCPFCGGKAFVNSWEHTERTRYVFVAHVLCRDCQSSAGSKGFHNTAGEAEEATTAAWNRRTPEPMTSVVKWTRYDGTPETLPEEGVAFLCTVSGCLLRQSCSFHPGNGPYEVMGDMLPDPHNFAVGDLWAHLPTLPEGME